MRKRVRRCDPLKQERWQGIVRRWEQDGRSVREFCRAEGVREAAFYWWRRELVRRRQTAGGRSPSSPRHVPMTVLSREASGTCRPPASFLPVQVVAEDRGKASGGVEVVVGQGRRVCVHAGFDPQTLCDVLRVLESLPC